MCDDVVEHLHYSRAMLVVAQLLANSGGDNDLETCT